jgi:hypothetical protein
MFLGLPYPDPLVQCTGPDQDNSIIISSGKNSKKNLDFLLWCGFFMTFCPSKNAVAKNVEQNFLVAILKVTEENSSIRIR